MNETPPACLEKTEDASDDGSRRAAKKGLARTRNLLRALWLTAGLARRLLVAAALVLSLLLNGFLIFSDAVQTAVGAAASAVGLRTVAARQADSIARTSAMLAAEREALRKTKAALDETRKVGDAARKRAKETAERVNRRLQRAAAREAAVMPAKIIPVLGATAIVAATTWEIHDMCETMKDMSELARAFDSVSAPAAEGPTVCSMEVPYRKELFERAMSPPTETWESVRAALDGLGSEEIGRDRLPAILDFPQDVLERSMGAWDDQTRNLKLWWHGRQ